MKADRAVWICLLLLVASILIACTAGSAKKAAPAKTAARADPAGAELYRAYCASCHGVSARGSGPAAAALRIPPPDLTNLARRHAGHFPSGQVYQVIEWGGAIASHGSREMPVWGVAFRPMGSENQREVSARIHALTEYVEAIQVK